MVPPPVAGGFNFSLTSLPYRKKERLPSFTARCGVGDAVRGQPSCRGVVGAAVAGLLLRGMASAGAPPPRYEVSPTSVQVTLAQPPPGSWQSLITIQRGRASPNEVVRYSVLGDFVSPDGRTLPRQYIVIQNEYGDPAASSDVVVLAARDAEASFTVVVRPEAWYDDNQPGLWRYAGIYSGYLISNVCGINPYTGCGAVPIQLTVDLRPYQQLEVNPSGFSITALLGIGVYQSAEAVTVTVRANHREWQLRQAYVAPARVGSNPSQTIPLSRLAASEDGGPYQPVPTQERVWLGGAAFSEPRLVSRSVRLQVEVTLADSPGTYTGRMDLTLESTS